METAKLPVGCFVNTETGEITDVIYEGDVVRVVRNKQTKYYQNNKKEIEKDRIYRFGQDKNFSMLSEFSARQLANENLTSSEYRVLLLMISNTNYKSGLVTLDNNWPMTKDHVSKALDLSSKTVERCLCVLVNKGIINRSTTNHVTKYFFNPYIQYKGAWINRTLYEMFKNTKWAKRERK